MTPKERRAFQIRDAARVLLEREGLMGSPGRKFGPCVQWEWSRGGMTIKFRRFTYPERTWRPHGVDIWIPRAGAYPGAQQKVFNLEWDDEGDFQILNFKRGDWEEKIIAADPGA